jgi:hypothetical protein
MSSRPAQQRHEHTVAVTRVFDAPRGRVFAAPVPAVLVKLLRDKNPA